MVGAFPVVLMATLATFFAGRGQTRVVLVVHVLSTLVDIVLNYLWIFGHGGFPRAGVAGAAWSTVVSQALGALIFIVLILRPAHRRAYATLSGWRFDRALFVRLLRFGLPSGLQYSLEILAFAIFMMIVGRIGTAPLAASGIAFNLNMIVFMPMLGLGVAVSALVGRYLGADHPDAGGARHLVGLLDEPRLHDGLRRPVPPGAARAPLSRTRRGRTATFAEIESDRGRAPPVRRPLLAVRHDERDLRGRAARGGGHVLPAGPDRRPLLGGDAGAGLPRLRGGRRAGSTPPGRRPAPTCSCSGS